MRSVVNSPGSIVYSRYPGGGLKNENLRQIVVMDINFINGYERRVSYYTLAH